MSGLSKDIRHHIFRTVLNCVTLKEMFMLSYMCLELFNLFCTPKSNFKLVPLCLHIQENSHLLSQVLSEHVMKLETCHCCGIRDGVTAAGATSSRAGF